MIQYLFTVSLCWIILYGLYYFLFEKETFFHSNRGYLLASLVLGALIPAYTWIPTAWFTQPRELTSYIYATEVLLKNTETQGADNYNRMWLLGFIYWGGVGLMGLRFLHGLSRIVKLRLGGKTEYRNGLHLIHTAGDHLPFSFIRSIYISEKFPLSEAMESIIQHEEVHVRSWHTLDVFIVQVLHIFFWFNPILILYKNSIQQLHEFAADAMVIKDISRKSYGQLLLRQSQSGLEIALANHFFHSQIKKRIQMMYKERSKRPAMAKYLWALPVLFILLVSFSTKSAQSNENTTGLISNDISVSKNAPVIIQAPCKNQMLYSDNYKGKGHLTILFCEVNGKVTYAEIIERETNLDKSMHKEVLNQFYSGKIKRTESNVKPLPKPPVPPAPPTPPSPPEAPQAPTPPTPLEAPTPPTPPTPVEAPNEPAPPMPVEAPKEPMPPTPKEIPAEPKEKLPPASPKKSKVKKSVDGIVYNG